MPNFVISNDGEEKKVTLNGGCEITKPVDKGQFVYRCGSTDKVTVALFRDRYPEGSSEAAIVAGIVTIAKDVVSYIWLKSSNVIYDMIDAPKVVRSFNDENSVVVSEKTLKILVKILDIPAEKQPAIFLLELGREGFSEADITEALYELAANLTEMVEAPLMAA